MLLVKRDTAVMNHMISTRSSRLKMNLMAMIDNPLRGMMAVNPRTTSTTDVRPRVRLEIHHLLASVDVSRHQHAVKAHQGTTRLLRLCLTTLRSHPGKRLNWITDTAALLKVPPLRAILCRWTSWDSCPGMPIIRKSKS